MPLDGLRVHRGVLQPQATALDPRVQVAETIPGELAQRPAPGKTGSMSDTGWKTKSRGKVIAKGIDFVILNPALHRELSDRSIAKISAGFTSNSEAAQYLKL